jgi:putative SOS response-associated peptidase YedK
MEANAIVSPIPSKAMPVILTTTEEFELWLEGETVEALKLQRPLPGGMLDIVARGESEDGASDRLPLIVRLTAPTKGPMRCHKLARGNIPA